MSTSKISPLVWDGGFLGSFPKRILGAKIRVKNGLTIRFLETATFQTCGVLKCPRESSIPCVLDELKACFGLPKIGTHRLKISGRLYVLYRCTLSDVVLNHVDASVITKKVRQKMQGLISYRYLLSIPHSQNSSFIFRPNKGERGGEPYSLYEPKTYVDQCTVDPTEAFLQSWFGEITFHKAVLDILPRKKEEKMSVFLFSLRQEIERRIERIDVDYVWIASHLVEKISKLFAEFQDE